MPRIFLNILSEIVSRGFLVIELTPAKNPLASAGDCHFVESKI
jgi:hypothetical protein